MPPKRKRPDRPSIDGGRPPPHHPEDVPQIYYEMGDAGSRDRGGYGALNRRDSNHGRRSSIHHNTQNVQNQTPSQAQSPPATMSKHPKTPSSPAVRKQPGPSPSVPTLNSPVPSQAAMEPAQRPAHSVRSLYFYDQLTDEKIRTWAEHGRQQIAEHGVQSREDMDSTELSDLFQEFVHAVVEARLDPTDAGTCVKEILGEDTSGIINSSYPFAPHSLFLDTLSIMVDNDPDLYRPSVKQFIVATGVSPTLMREILDAPLLQQLGLIRDNFARLGVRQATNLLYRQANYNLLREESEGYSKLITELFSTNSIPPPPPGKTFEKVKALIGTFDLDVGRVLDVTLDVTASILIKQYKFFVKFLRTSSWWPSSRLSDDSAFVGGLPAWAEPDYPHWVTSEEDEEINSRLKLDRDMAFWERARDVKLTAFFELGGRRVMEEHLQQDPATGGSGSGEAELDAAQKWIRETNTLPAPGNRVAAQLLGFKLRFYNSDIREKSDVLPANLLYLAALLIKIGFISLADLYSHLSPDDAEMEKVRDEEMEKQATEQRESHGGQMNALLMAGVLPQGEDDNPSAVNTTRRETAKRVEAEQKKVAVEEPVDNNKLQPPLEQKISLLTQLLTIGAIPESLFLLGRFPWAVEVFPDILQRIHRILHVCLDKVYNDSRPSPAISFPAKQMIDIDQTGMPKGSVRLTQPPAKKVWRWPFPDKNDTNENQNYRFYWDEWSDNIPVCQTVDDVFTLCGTLMNISGVRIGKDEALLSKLASIGAMSLADDQSDANRARWEELLRRLLLPALSHTKANTAVVRAIWELVKQYPLITRYNMYAEWFEGSISRLPAMKAVFSKSAAETRATMKRVSLTNLSEMAKRLAKTSYSSPGIVFKVAFEQLEVYSNLIEAFVECARYFTDLSYDVLVWSLLTSLGKSRSRVQENHALTTSKWLTALSRFSGKVFRRYSLLDSVPVLKYVDDQLFNGNSTDLVILKEFISSMGGIVDSVDFTDYQILSMAGGSWLRRHTLIRAQDKRFDSVKSSDRLMQALCDSKLAARLLINLSQYRQVAIYRVPEDEAHIKYLSSILDDSHQSLIQYIDFLWSNLEPAAFDAIVPSIPRLIRSFGLETDIAFLIGRASLAHRMFPWKDAKASRDAIEAAKAISDKEGDVTMSGTKPSAKVPSPSGATDGEDQQQKPDDHSLTRTVFTALHPIVNSIQGSVDPGVWERMTPEFYAIFWALQLGDLCFPENIYLQERTRLMGEWQALANDRSDMSRRALDRKAEKKKELMDISGYLLDELSDHGLRKAKWKFYLTKQFQVAFPDSAAKPEIIADLLLEHCFLPRVRLSPADVEYTYRFIKALHEWNAPGFRFMVFLDRLFNTNRLRTLIFSCTVREAEYLGRFLKLVLADLSRWHKNEVNKKAKSAKDALGDYDKEAKGPSDQPRIGFAIKVNNQGKPEGFVDHSHFRDMLFRWHKNINMALKSCLGGSEWMHIRNAITVLNAVLDHFPAVDFMGAQFLAQLQVISKREAAAKETTFSEEGGRVDLSVAAQGAMSELQRRKSRWMMVQAFRSNAVSDAVVTIVSRVDTVSKAAGTQLETDKPTHPLRPTAPEFRPQPSQPIARKPSAAEEEDGEVRDSKRRFSVGTPKDSLPSKPFDAIKDSKKDDYSRHNHRPMGHNLPNRPDVPIPALSTPERYGQSRVQDHRDGRGSREPRGAQDRPWDGREVREPHREGWERPSDQDRQGRPREYAERRTTDGAGEMPRHDLPPRPHRESRGGRALDRQELSGQGFAAAPANDPAADAAMNPERAAFFGNDDAERTPDHAARRPESDRQPRGRSQTAADSMDMQSAERGTMAEDHKDSTPNSQGRPPRDEGRERIPRTASPHRSGRLQGYGPPAGYDDRQGRPFASDPRLDRDHRNRSPLPGNFRSDWATDRDAATDPMRSSPGFHRPGPRIPESDHRLPHQDQNYGRLNAIPSTSDIPLGPRGRGRGSTRGGFRGGFDHGGGFHMDRKQNYFGHGNDGSTASTTSAPPSRGVHPDRLAQLGTLPPHMPLPHGEGSYGRHPNSGDRHVSGTRQPYSAMDLSSMEPGVSTGPIPPGDRARGGGDRRQLAGINNMLQQSLTLPEASRNSGMRAQPRPLLGNSDAQVLTGGSAASTPGVDRQDVLWSGSNGAENQLRRDYRGDRPDRSSRSSRRGSRERERDASPRPGWDGEIKDQGEYRDRRSTGGVEAGNNERELRRPGRDGSGRDLMGFPPTDGRDLMAGREGGHRGEPRVGVSRAEDWVGGNAGGGGYRGVGRGGPRDGDGRPPEERHEVRDDRGRKRRSVDGVGHLTSEREKRPRR
ncbi:hypothetical protein RJ55_04111 [Drechmeria coniospora]|nr:hypothetical protein RJ55_04111 [Drechmeria coniospora]